MSDRHKKLVLPEGQIQRELRRRTRRDFLIAGVAAAGAIGGYTWMTSKEGEDGIPIAQRRVLNFNGKLSREYLSDSHLMPAYSLRDVKYLKPNGDLGMSDEVSNENWKIQLTTSEDLAPLNIVLSDIMALPKTEMIVKFCCIEGWSTIAYWGGARFRDFTKKFFPARRQLPPYVYLSTPNEEYYVGLDMKSALHPQTLLAYEKDGKPLTAEHGAPLRLVIPVKYGIKSIKRIGSIEYTNQKPNDYWAEEGYDWFAGL